MLLANIFHRIIKLFKINPRLTNFNLAEEVILAEERTTEEEKMHIMEARRRAAKKKKLKKMGKSKSTDTEEEQEEEDVGDDGKIFSFNFQYNFPLFYKTLHRLCIRFQNSCLYVHLN